MAVRQVALSKLERGRTWGQYTAVVDEFTLTYDMYVPGT